MILHKLRMYKSSTAAAKAAENVEIEDALFHGDSLHLAKALPSNSVDLVFSSPPYCMGKSYETTSSVKDFVDFHERLIPDLLRITKPGGSICWQVGCHSDGRRITPLDFLAHDIFSKYNDLFLRNRVIWIFAHGLHAKKRFSGRHETVLWYTKGKDSAFNLDAVRVPQKYPGKRSYRGPNRGDFSGNPLGKNPGDVWNIPNVKGYHVEKTVHPCQFPVALPIPFIRALVPLNGLIFDPFMGVGSTGVAAAIEGRRFLGGEILKEYVVVAKQRILAARNGRANIVRLSSRYMNLRLRPQLRKDQSTSGGEMSASKKFKTAKKSAKRKHKKAPSPQQIAQRRQKAKIRALFARMGFSRIKSDGVEFTFRGRTGELDDIFLFENIVVIAEYTIGAPSSEHVSKKSILYGKIKDHSSEWIDFARTIYPNLNSAVESEDYESDDYRVRICYFSEHSVSEEIESAYSFLFFLNGAKFRYFDALSKTIRKSAKVEFFKYLGLHFKEIGSEINNSGTQAKVFRGHVLPEGYSSFPKGFKVVSFYADPNTLLTLSYVLRRDSWRDEEGMYQRVLQKSRMRQMRKYLTSEKRVFVNNIIATLPNDTKLNDPDDAGKNIDPKKILKVQDVNVVVPLESNSIGLVDGQHRVYCYHEGTDKYEPQIKALRQRQNLLVTGIVFPAGFDEVAKRRFEAKLFLEINDKQKRTKSELRQSIELILNPYSPVAIAKAVVQKLNGGGALKGLLQTNYFDPPNLIRTTSIVSYGLRPLLKLDGGDSLFSVWDDPDKQRLKELQQGAEPDNKSEELLNRYIDYSAEKINALLLAARKADPDRWRLSDNPKLKLLTPTIVNGFIVCLRLMVQDKKLGSGASYEKRLANLSTFQYAKYKSSHWRALGEALFKFF